MGNKSAFMFFFKKVGGRCGCVYGTKGAVDRKSLETAVLDDVQVSVNVKGSEEDSRFAEARVRSRVSQCEICGGQNGTGTGFSPSCRFSPVNFIPLVLH
jgi:hypothetical protein